MKIAPAAPAAPVIYFSRWSVDGAPYLASGHRHANELHGGKFMRGRAFPLCALLFALILSLAVAPARAMQRANEFRQSAALRAIIAAPEASRDALLARFWADRRVAGGPLIESGSRCGSSLVTFLFRHEPSITGVTVEAPLDSLLVSAAGGDLDRAGRMELLPGTDIWALSIEADNRLRTAYRFVVRREGEERARTTGDALNARRFGERSPAEGSLLELRAAPAQAWTRPELQRGEWRRMSMPARIAGQQPREVFIYFPSGYDPRRTEPYPLLIAQQSLSFGVAMPTGRIVEALVAAGRIPPTVIVTTELATGEDVGHLDQFVRHVADELIPWTRSQANVSRDPRHVAIAGTSRRGLSAAYAAWSRPELIGNVLSLSGAFYWAPAGDPDLEWFMRLVSRETERRNVRFFLAAGSLETVTTPRNRGRNPLATTRNLANLLSRRGYTVCRHEFYGGHGEVNWQDALPYGLTCLFQIRR